MWVGVSNEFGTKRLGENADEKDKRHYIRAMSKASAVPVEPQEQTNLLEESILAPGVIGGTVPGGNSSLLHLV